MANDNTANIKVNKELHKKLKDYLEIANKNSKKGDKTIKQTDIINMLLDDFLKDKIINTDFIELDKPFYFNLTELTTNKKTLATAIEPINDLNNVGIIRKIPINLDKYNERYKTYCYKDYSNLHRGIYIYNNITDYVSNTLEITDYFLIFSYNIDNQEVNISLIDPIDLDLYVDNPAIINYLLKENDEFKELLNNDNDNRAKHIFKSMEVIEYYPFKKTVLEPIFIEELEKYIENNRDFAPADIDMSTIKRFFEDIYCDHIKLKKYVGNKEKFFNDLEKKGKKLDKHLEEMEKIGLY